MDSLSIREYLDISRTLYLRNKGILPEEEVPFKPLVIGITGRHEVGKDTVGVELVRYFVKEHSIRKFVVCGGFDGLKQEFAKQFKTTVGALNEAKHTALGRQVLELWGMITPDETRIQSWENELNRHVSTGKELIVVTGIRRKDEASFLRSKYNAIIIRVNRGQEASATLLPMEAEIRHIPYDFFLNNDGSFLMLHHQCVDLANQITSTPICQKFLQQSRFKLYSSPQLQSP